VSLLVMWDTLANQRTFLDPLDENEQHDLNLANATVFDVALSLVDSISERSARSGTGLEGQLLTT
jgi:hypothetical protein